MKAILMTAPGGTGVLKLATIAEPPLADPTALNSRPGFDKSGLACVV